MCVCVCVCVCLAYFYYIIVAVFTENNILNSNYLLYAISLVLSILPWLKQHSSIPSILQWPIHSVFLSSTLSFFV